MLVLYETPLGFCLFKIKDGKIDSDELWKEFETPEKANSLLKLKAIHRFTSTAAAVEDISALQEGKLSSALKKFLTEEVVTKGKGKEKLAVVDPKLGSSIHKKLGIEVVVDSSSLDLYRGIRSQLASLLDGVDPEDMKTMSLGLSHSLSRYKLKFSPDKIDTMVVQAIGLLDDLDKEINLYAMRLKEWYGWHFPEMAKIIVDNVAFAKVVRAMGPRTNASSTNLSSILPSELEATLKASAEISMGSEVSPSDITHINSLCSQVISISEYRTQLSEYLRNRMNAIAPNLTALVGEMVGARLISHAGSLRSLAKHPASTVQILGAEKALFRALKTKHDTPKYGLIYHASLVGQAPQKLKGKMARMVATKAALSIRVDALTDIDAKSDPLAPTIGIENRAKLESRLRALEHQSDLSGFRTGFNVANDPSSSRKKQQAKFELGSGVKTYNTAADSVMKSADAEGEGEEKDEDALQEARRKRKEEKKREKEAKKEKKEKRVQEMEVDGQDDDDEAAKKEKKRLKKEKKAAEKAAASGAASGVGKIESADVSTAESSSKGKKRSRDEDGEGVKKKKKKE